MGETKQTSLKRSNVISASEIGQYVYCPMSWYLQQCGYEPESPSLDIGNNAHIDLGNKIDLIKTETRRSRKYAVIGYLLLIVAIIIIFLEVFL